MRTLAGSAIGGARKVFKECEENAPLRRNASLEHVGGAAVYLLSDLGASTTATSFSSMAATTRSAWRSRKTSDPSRTQRLYLTDDQFSLGMALAAIGFLFTLLSGIGGFLGPRGSMALTWSPQALFLAAISIAFAIFYFGVSGGIAIIVTIVWHEWGHVIAYRVAGHSDARFRLIPLLGGVAISNQSPKNQAASCFVTLMGPGFSISLVVGLFLLASWLAGQGSPYYADVYWAAMIAGVINAFNMLPLWPLDGGRAIRAITVTAAPGLAGVLTTLMSAVLIGFAVVKQMWLMLLFGLMGYSYARRAAKYEANLAPMTRGQAILATIAYLAILAAHVLAGLPLFRRIIGI